MTDVGRRERVGARVVAALLTVVGSLVPLEEAGAQAFRPDSLSVGRVVERVSSSSDRSQEYALYLPSDFDDARSWPVLFLLDPRGRALVPLELYREPAEKHGYVVMSAWGSLSDGPAEPTVRALDAMLEDAQARFAVDTHRLYLVGFSGTARISWLFARSLAGYVAGVIGFGAGFPSPDDPAAFEPLSKTAFSFFGGSGSVDFNYEEMRRMRGALEPLGIPSQVRHWPGGHGWPPPEVAQASVEWMEAHAMKSGLAELDVSWMASHLARGMSEAEGLARAGRVLEAAERYRALRQTYAGLADLSLLRSRLAELESSAAYRDAARRADERAARHAGLMDNLSLLVFEGREQNEPLRIDRAVDWLEIEALHEDLRRGDEETAAAARRVLETYMSQFSFYVPREHIAAGRSEAALAALKLAERIFPGRRASLCYRRAVAHALAERADETLEYAACVRAGSLEAAKRLLAEPALAFLAGDPRFEELRREVGGPG